MKIYVWNFYVPQCYIKSCNWVHNASRKHSTSAYEVGQIDYLSLVGPFKLIW